MYHPTELPAPLAQVLDEVRALPVGEAPAMAPAERATWLAGLRQLVDAAQAASLAVLGSFDANGDGEVLHAARSTTSWLTGALGVAGSGAASQVQLARASRRELAPAVEQLRQGTLTYDHLRAIGRAVRDLPDEQTTPAARVLTELATTADVASVVQTGRHLAHVVDPDGTLKTTERDYSRRRLHLSPLLDGMVALDGLLDTEAAATLNAALEPFLVPAGDDDDRTTPQRRADGLVAVAGVALSQSRLPVTGGARPGMTVLTTLDALTAAGGTGTVEPTPGGGGVVGSLAIDRVACDAAVARVLLSPEGVPLDLGRSQRLFSPAQRKLLALRDGGCRFPGCGLPPAFTDAHHLIAWQHGGASDLDNAVLVCRHHHRMVHEGGWTTEPTGQRGANGELRFTSRRGVVLSSTPRQLTTEQLGAIAWWHAPPDTS